MKINADLARAIKVFVKNHQGHHPVACIGECDPDKCGQDRLHEVIAEQETVEQLDLLEEV